MRGLFARFRAFVLVAALSFSIAGVAMADSFTISSASNSTVFANGSEWTALTTPSNTQTIEYAGEYSVKITDTSTSTSQIVNAWSVDAYDTLKLPATFTSDLLTTANTNATELERLNALLVNGQSTVKNATSSAALQYAIWEVENETTNSYNVTNGTFKITSNGGGSAVTALANQEIGYVLNGTWQASTNYQLMAYVPSSTNQYLVVLEPVVSVSEAGTFSLLAAGLAALMALHRGRQD